MSDPKPPLRRVGAFSRPTPPETTQVRRPLQAPSLSTDYRTLVQRTVPLETTRLAPPEEAQFRAWARKRGITDVDAPDAFYDYRGAFRDQLASRVNAEDGRPHWPDTYKQHGHPTFSVESKYSSGPGDGGTWGGPNGETFSAPTRADTAMMVSRLRQLLAASLAGQKVQP